MPSALTFQRSRHLMSMNPRGRPRVLAPSLYPEIVDRYQSGESMDAIAGTHHVSRNTIRRALRECGVTLRSKTDWTKDQKRGAESPHWRGGRTVTSEGYVRVYADPSHPWYDVMTVRHGSARYFPEHRLVMAEYLGRPLTSNEEVHHVNGIHDDNRLDNLELRLGAHGAGQCWQCVQCGSHDIRAVELQPCRAA